MSNRWQTIKAYADLADKQPDTPWLWWEKPENLGLDIKPKAAKNAAYQAYRSGMLEKSDVEENSYRFAESGRGYLEKHPTPPYQGKNLSKARKAIKNKAKTTTKVDQQVTLGTLYEVVGVDRSGNLVARSTEDNTIWTMEKI